MTVLFGGTYKKSDDVGNSVFDKLVDYFAKGRPLEEVLQKTMNHKIMHAIVWQLQNYGKSFCILENYKQSSNMKRIWTIINMKA